MTVCAEWLGDMEYEPGQVYRMFNVIESDDPDYPVGSTITDGGVRWKGYKPQIGYGRMWFGTTQRLMI